MKLEAYIRDIDGFPKEGIVFKDITPLLADGKAFSFAIEQMSEIALEYKANLIIAPEARGFIFGAAVAAKIGVGFIPVRKKGKLPFKTYEVSYELEYGKETLEIHSDALNSDSRVLFVDDVLATGGTFIAANNLCKQLNAKLLGGVFLMELEFLEARKKLNNLKLNRLLKY